MPRKVQVKLTDILPLNPPQSFWIVFTCLIEGAIPGALDHRCYGRTNFANSASSSSTDSDLKAAQAALGDPLQYIGNLPFNIMPPMAGQPPSLDPAVATPIPGMVTELRGVTDLLSLVCFQKQPLLRPEAAGSGPGDAYFSYLARACS